MSGYAGKILKVNLTKKEITAIPTKKYDQWVGGHGMGSAIFFDLVKDKTIDGFDPANVVTLMTSPLSGTLVPAASGRTEVQGIGVQSYPIGWFTRSNFGGRFSSMLKYAGWDGVVVVGKASRPVWIDIRNDDVKIRECASLSLWGKDTWECQERIWDYVAGKGKYGEWVKQEGSEARTTQRPAVVAIGPAGENMSRLACLIHDASNAGGQGGFGAVLGSKNLKAISVIGTGGIKIHDPQGLMEARLWQKKNYAFDLENLKRTQGGFEFQAPPLPVALWRGGRPRSDQRPQACIGCHSGCRARYEDKLGNEASCFATVFYWDADSHEIQRKASDLINQYGLNAVELCYGLLWLVLLNRYKQLDSGDIPKCPLDFGDLGSLDFVEQFVKMLSYGNDGLDSKSQFGEDITQGFVRAAKKWGRLKADLKSGLLMFPYWGIPIHKEPRAQVYWGYGTILGDRDINEHDLDWLKWDASIAKRYGRRPQASAEEVVKIITDKMEPFQGDTLMLDFSDNNIYSEHMAKLVSWHRYYTRFWKQSTLFCDVRWPDFLNLHSPDKIGSTGIAEPKFLNVVTGKKMSFLDGINLGKKIWNLDHAIWTLQGRHRDMVHFADFIYTKPGTRVDVPNAYLPGLEDGKWDYYGYTDRRLDKNKFEKFKTTFYKLQGWNTETGYPVKGTLESLGLGYVAEELNKNGKLGKG
ncbi:MAG: aldehyde:ferredoxin oxidoreductase [Deltaproteobacteria bacterium]|nr:aldehyde:ferredoxin oxidoreductase [Deltaproteobacteria bacterium]MBW2053150.1 aldehyde:ferredoxin oxidoreductase [Deltaproteobacteria bacterium]MBW2141601.1 aldehyde:ferredoxin oxidoreductase [Deltaproteobacteria bacterium]MBW2324144.1 aldehyde:ferredoxin oxidoreductase [Deltaproteobacteria bacterium]